jgi:methylthioribose-1-phosphate isomerase
MRTVEWVDGKVQMIDQRRLPWELAHMQFDDYRQVARAITDMAVRGAPAIGAAAAFGMALAARQSAARDRGGLLRDLEEAARVLVGARPTAANLAWAVARQMRWARDEARATPEALRRALLEEAQCIADEDVAVNRRMGAHGAELIKDGDSILHHCNTGALATVDYGTALGVIRCAHEQGKEVHVLLDETRPRLQGARLSAWELKQLGIPFHIIADNAAGHYMRTGRVNILLVGADRVAANGDVANKIGTYKLAVVAHENGIPFYSVAPTSSIDLSLSSGDDIPIEERDPDEVRTAFGYPIVPDDYPACNPAFDVTPHRYLTGIVTEHGVVYPPFDPNLRRAVKAEAVR